MSTTARTLTYAQLYDKRPCLHQLNRFKELFGDSVEVTKELCESVALEFDWSWAVRNLLSETAQWKYHALWNAEYDAWDRLKFTWQARPSRTFDFGTPYERKSYTDSYKKFKTKLAAIFGELYANDVEAAREYKP